MTPAVEPSFIMTLIPIFLGGVVSSVLTLLLGQPLQHYFWRRQRLAERQLAALDEFNQVTAQVLHLCHIDYDNAATEHRAPKGDAKDPVVLALSMLQPRIRVLFSTSAAEAAYELMDQLVALGGSIPDTPWLQAVAPIVRARERALRALYKDMGIPLPN